MKHTAQALPPEMNTVAATLDVQKTRRQVIVGAAGLAAFFSVRGVDRAITHHIWDDDESSIDPLSECAAMCASETWGQSEVWTGAPGMAHKSGGPVARAVAQTALGIPDSKRIMTAIRLSDSGMSDRTYPTLLSKLGNRCNWLSVAGQSMGGVAAIEGLRMLSKLPEGRRIPLGRVVLFGTPLRIENVRNDFIADVMAKAARMYGGGLGGRILSNIGVEAKSGRRGLLLDVLSGFRHSTYKALQGDSPFIEATGLALLNDTHLLDNYRDMRGIIGPNTRFAFVSSDQDNVVDCDKAVEDWGNFVSDCGGQFSHFRSRPGTGHANVEVGSEELPHWIEGTNDFY